jgi:2-polyprenyl-6-methoxyphenol hydroxylase-like FAD-dependent oxidoreductase
MKYDVIVVGASIGGCTAAILYARHGLRVALVEKATDLAHYKKLCGHYLQPAAVETIRRLGLAERIEEAGGLRNDMEVWTEWGWIRGTNPVSPGHGYNIRRQMLDPILRRLAVETPGVSYHAGASVCTLIRDPRGRAAGVVVEHGAGLSRFRAPLVVAADGRTSRLARLAGVEATVHPNQRFTYYTYYRGLPSNTPVSSSFWHLHPNVAAACRNDDDTTMLAIGLPRSELRAFKTDPLGNFLRFWDQVPDAPRIGGSQPICALRGITEIPNHWRPAAAPGIAFVGDAAMVLDPAWGTGCSFAFQSAEWLVEQTAPAYGAATDPRKALDRGLERYRKQHRSRTRWHYAHTVGFSQVRPLNPVERLVFSAAARDSRVANHVVSFFGRTVEPPSVLGRAALVNLGMLNLGRRLRAVVTAGRGRASMPLASKPSQI